MTIKTIKESYRQGRTENNPLRSAVILLLMVTPLRGLFLMLGLGVLHNDWTPEVPALGFWGSILVALMITGVIRK